MSRGTLFQEKDGLTTIKPIDHKKQPANCPVCKLAFRHKEDLIEYNNYGCCTDCSLHFYYPNKEKWAQGWRPSRKQIKKAINILGEKK